MPLIRDTIRGVQTRSRRSSLPYLGGRSTSAGVDVTPERALQISAVYSCITTHADDGAGLPLGLFRKAGRGLQAVDDHPVMPLLTYAPNPIIDAAEFWRLIFGWMGLRGNAYAYIERDGNGRPIRLWPIAPTCVEILRNNKPTDPTRAGLLIYQVLLDNLLEYAPIREPGGLVQPENMLHFRLFGLGPWGLSPVGLARQQIGTAFAATEYIGGFFARDASPGGTLTVDGNLTDDQYERLEQQWKEVHEGPGNSHRLGILEGGAKWDSVSLSPADASFLDTMKFGRTEIAAMYRMPAHKIGDLDHATFSNIEQLSIEYVGGLTPYLVRGEQVAGRLLGDAALRLRFDTKGLLRGDIASRYTAYAAARQWGWKSVNDILVDEGEQTIGADGDEYLQPLNMVPAGSAAPPAARSADAPPPAPVPDGFLPAGWKLVRDELDQQRRDTNVVEANATMVALFPPAGVAEALAVDGGLPVDELHVTLAYLGDDLTDEQLATVATITEAVAAQHAQLAGALGGLGQFPAGPDGTPVYAPVDVPGLAELRGRLVEQLAGAGIPLPSEHGFTPHMTLTYLQDDDDPPPAVASTAVGFAALSVAHGGTRTDYPFAGVRSQRTAEPPAQAHPSWVTHQTHGLVDFFIEQREEILGKLTTNRMLRDVSDLVDVDYWNDRLASLLEPYSVDITNQLAASAAQALGGSYDAARAAAFLKAFAERHARNINLTTSTQIEAALTDPDSDDPATAVGGIFAAAVSTRASQVAVGLVNQVGSFAQHEGSQQAGAAMKTWVTGGVKPRPSHAFMNGETVGIEDTFSNGGAWPHDPAAGVDEVAGCTCTATYSKE